MRSLVLRCLLTAVATACSALHDGDLDEPPLAAAHAIPHGGSAYRTHRAIDPPRTEVFDPAGRWIATFTDGAYTVLVAGPERTFGEETTPHTVTVSTWVRLLPRPFDGQVDTRWLSERLRDHAPDVLAHASQYLQGAPPVVDDGLQIAGDAAYGPVVDGSRQEGADWNDYLGIAATYPDGRIDDPEPLQHLSLDCSGFLRMVFGYRGGLPLLAPSRPLDDTSLPRRAVMMHERAAGVITVPDRGEQVTDFTRLAAGDLVFFDASTDDGTAIDHVGIYLGVDSAGHHRFVSSRKSINGPTLGDYRGASILDGEGLYARTFRAVRRL